MTTRHSLACTSNSEMCLSVVVIGLNEAPILRDCLQSARVACNNALRHKRSWELIYVDSGSNDDSVAIAEEHCDRVFIITKHPSAAAGRNVGLMYAKGKVILFLDGDMVLHKDWLCTALRFESSWVRPIVGAVGIRDDVYYGSDGRVIGSRQNVYGVRSRRLAGTFGGAILIHRGAMLGVGGYRQEMKAWEDPDLHARLRAQGLHLLELPVPFVSHHTALPRRTIRSLLASDGSAERFGYWVIDARRDGYLGSLVGLKKWTFGILGTDLVSAVLVCARAWHVALVVQAASSSAMILAGRARELVLARIWGYGIIRAAGRSMLRRWPRQSPDPEWYELAQNRDDGQCDRLH